MRCSPTQKNSRVWAIVAALLLFGGITYAVPIYCNANEIKIGGALFQFITVISIVIAVFVVVRYQMTHFTYIIRPRSDASDFDDTDSAFAYAGVTAGSKISHLPPDMLDFAVNRSQGSRAGGAECVLSLSDLVAVYSPAKNSRELKNAIRKRYIADGYVYYDYTVTLGSNEVMPLVFIDGNRYVGIFIEPDDTMRDYFLSLGKTKR